MPSFSAISAAAILAFSGVVSAIPQYTNGTATSPYSTGNSTTSAGAASGTGVSPATDAAYCPKLNGGMVNLGGKSYVIECGKNHFGTQIEISLSKRAAYTSLGDCISLCDSVSTCVGTAFDLDARSCTLYSDVGAEVTDAGTDFALVVASGDAASTTASAGQELTLTDYSTTVKTVLSCAPTVTNCPLRSTAGAVAAGVVTEVIAVTSTTYTCPAATTLPASPVACTNCPYSPATVTQYAASSASGTTTFVAVSTAVINYPQPTGTTVTVTVCTACAAETATATGISTVATAGSSAGSNANYGSGSAAGAASGTGSVASATTSGMAVYTGAAGQVKAGMGFAAFVAGAAVLL